MRIIFSKDRPAQLDLLLRSLRRYAPPEDTTVIARDLTAGYVEVAADYPEARFTFENGHLFDEILRGTLAEAGSTVTFFCDDDVCFRQWQYDPRSMLVEQYMLAFSLRLSSSRAWRWADYPPHDHGYPGSIDGHTFRTADVLEMLGAQAVENPTMLETRLAGRVDALAKRRPLMAAFSEQVLVGVDVNRVSDQTGVTRRATRFPQPVEELAALFEAGLRIDLDALDFSDVDGCHTEIEFVWSDREALV